jgi:hypothetical protein
MVELVTLNEALPGDSPDYKKKNIYNKYKKSFFIIISMNMFSV